MNIPFVDLKAQYNSIKVEIDEAIKEVIQNTAFIGGPWVKKFENEFAEYSKVKYCISCANGTDAIQIMLKALNIGSGDEVIVPANSFIASSESVTAVGAKVVFCDVDKTDNIDVTLLESKITNKTKALLAVHLYGKPADLDSIKEITDRHNIVLLEDAAQAHGAQYKSKTIGTIGQAASFSFYPGKNLGCYGDGGAIITNDDALAVKLKMWSNHGRIEKYNHEFEAFNSRLDGIQAAILSAKLPHLDNWIEKRRNVAAEYTRELKETGDIILPEDSDNIKTVYHLFVIKTAERNKLKLFLKEKGISTGIHYPIGLPFLKAYNYLGHNISDFPVTAKNQDIILSLPIFPEMTSGQIDYVIDCIKSFYN